MGPRVTQGFGTRSPGTPLSSNPKGFGDLGQLGFWWVRDLTPPESLQPPVLNGS